MIGARCWSTSQVLADGGEAIGDINVLRHQGQVLGPVASAPTVWRALDELAPAALKRIQVARARTINDRLPERCRVDDEEGQGHCSSQTEADEDHPSCQPLMDQPDDRHQDHDILF